MKITKAHLQNFAESLTASLETVANKIADIEAIINGDDSVEETTDEVVEENEDENDDMVEEPVVENEVETEEPTEEEFSEDEVETEEPTDEVVEDENFSEKHYSDVKNFFSL